MTNLIWIISCQIKTRRKTNFTLELVLGLSFSSCSHTSVLLLLSSSSLLPQMPRKKMTL